MGKKRIICVITAFLTFLSGCGLVPDGSISWEKQEADSVVIENNHAKGSLGEGIEVDADISGTELKEWKECTAVPRQFDDAAAERISRYFLGNSAYLNGIYDNYEAADGTSRYEYKKKSGEYVVTFSGQIGFNTPVCINNYYSTFVMPDKLLDEDTLNELFPLDSLDGFDKNNVINSFKTICSDLNIEISDNIRIHALDKDSANQIRKENDWLTRDKHENLLPDWTRDTEAYFILAPLSLNGIELPTQNTSSSTGSTYTSYVYAFYNRQGLIQFTASGMYEILDEKVVTDVHSINDVLNFLATNYSYLAGMNMNVAISDIKLTYIVKKYELDKKYKVLPTWVCREDTVIKTSKDGKEEEKTRTKYLYIDAQTMTSFAN